MALDLGKSTFSHKSSKADTTDKKLYSALYNKGRFTIPDASYHGLSMISNLPNSSQIKKLIGMLNSQYGIKRCPNNIVGVQQSIKVRIIQSLTHLVNQISKESTSIPETFRIKIIGDRTLHEDSTLYILLVLGDMMILYRTVDIIHY